MPLTKTDYSLVRLSSQDLYFSALNANLLRYILIGVHELYLKQICDLSFGLFDMLSSSWSRVICYVFGFWILVGTAKLFCQVNSIDF